MDASHCCAWPYSGYGGAVRPAGATAPGGASRAAPTSAGTACEALAAAGEAAEGEGGEESCSGEPELLRGWEEEARGSPSLLLVGSRDDTVSLYSGPPFRCLRIFSGHEAEVSAVCWLGAAALSSPPALPAAGGGGTPCSHVFASGACDALVKVWDARQRSSNPFPDCCLLTLLEHQTSITALAAAGPTQQMLVSGDADGVVKLWDMRRCTTSVCTLQYEGRIAEVQANAAYCLVNVALRRGKNALHLLDFSAPHPA